MTTSNALMWFAGNLQAQGNWRAGRWFALCSVNTFKPCFVAVPAGWFETIRPLRSAS